METIELPETPSPDFLTVIDKEGIPGTSYAYHIVAETDRIANTQSALYNCFHTFPLPPVPSNVQASDNYHSFIEVTWDYPANAKVDGFRIERLDRHQFGVNPPDIYIQASYTVGANERSFRETFDVPIGSSSPPNIYKGVYRVIAIRANQENGATNTELSDPNLDQGNITRSSDSNDTFSGAKDVSLEGDYLALGQPSATANQPWSTITVYHFDGSSWKSKGEVSKGGPFTGTTLGFENFGNSVDLAYPYLAVGTPNNGNDRIDVYNISSGVSHVDEVVLMNSLYGNSVAMSGTNILVGGPHHTLSSSPNHHGCIWYYALESSSINYKSFFHSQSFGSALGTGKQFGHDLALDNGQAMVGEPSIGAGGTGKVYFYRYNSDGTAHPDNRNVLTASDGVSGDEFGRFVDVQGDYAMAGSATGAYVFNKNGDGNWIEQQKLTSTGAGQYGDVATYGTLAVITKGQNAYLFKQNGSTWNLHYTFPNATGSSLVALAADLSADFLIVSSETASNIYDLLATPDNVSASQGDFTDKTLLNWDYAAIADIAGFRIYRNNVLINANLGPSERSYEDTEGAAGVKYVYEIEAYLNDNSNMYRRGKRVAIEGYRANDGSISGEVKTLIGQSPVEGVSIIAEAIVDGATYTYETTTDNNGSFSFENVFYGSGTATYNISANYLDHEFDYTVNSVDLSSTQPSAPNVLIFDKTAFVIQGKLQLSQTECGQDSIEVKVISNLSNGPLPTTIYTNEEGYYSTTINPDLVGLQSIQVEIPNVQTTGTVNNPQDINYDFDAINDNDNNNNDNKFVIGQQDLLNLQKVTTIDFLEKTTYPIEINVVNACGDAAITGTYEIRVRTADGCMDYRTTIANGNTVQLPPLNDLLINVVSVTNNSASNLLVLDYLQYRPSQLDLEDYHLDPSGNLPNVLLTYHKPPNISFEPFEDYMCSQSATNIGIVQQGNIYEHEVAVTESYGDINCSVQEGYVIVINPGAVKTRDTLAFDPSVNAFKPYTYLAGVPNLVFPHVWTMKLEYYSATGDFLGEKNEYLVVEGEASVPGNDVVVEPTAIPTPLFILRDPPGDRSSSSISKNESFSKEFTYKTSGDLSLALTNNLSTKLFGGTTKVSLSSNTSVGSGIGNTFKMSVSFEESISTSSSAGKIGESADIIVGAGIAYQYGIVEEIKVTDCVNGDGQITKYVKFGVAPEGINTTFIQTVKDIENTIHIDSQAILALKAIPIAQRDEDYEEDLERFRISKKGFESVLEYHRNQTKPINYLCDNVDAFIENIEQDRTFHFTVSGSNLGGTVLIPINEIYQWRDNFCTYKDTKLNTEGELEWDNDLLDAYNNTINAIRILSDPLLLANDIRVNDWHYPETGDAESILTDESLLNHVLANRFGKPGENITFGGGTSLTRNLSVGYSHANSFNFNLGQSFSAKFSIGANVDTDLSLELGTGFVSTGTITGLTEFKTDFTVSPKLSLKYSSDVKTSEATTHKVKYTLSDNDTGDQFSVNILQPLELNHTPSFVLIGGRSSCPPEPGTIFRDRPTIQIIQGAGTTQEASAFHVPEDEPAVFQVRIVNNSIYNETRSVTVFLDASTNENGAVVRLAGQLMGQQSFFSLEPNQALTLPVTIERGLTSYQHEDIQLKIRPYCTDGNVKFDPDVVSFNAQFQNPCSEISIITPDNNWLINGENNELILGLRDYETDNPIFESLKLQYRRTDTGDDWDDLPGRHLQSDLSDDPLAEPCDPVPYPVDKVCLADYNQQFFAPGQTPTFYMVWALPEDFTTYPDGQYEIRAVASCGTNGVTYSNIIDGRIDRSSFRLLGQAEPADGLWTTGDEISSRFNKDLNCSLFSDAIFTQEAFFLYHKDAETGNTNEIEATISCLNNQLVLKLSTPCPILMAIL